MGLPPRANMVELEFLRRFYALDTFEWPIAFRHGFLKQKNFEESRVWGYPTVLCSPNWYPSLMSTGQSWYRSVENLSHVVMLLLQQPR